jgi:23S rRNA (guanosine2251-2'-O)-methyltransferase
MGERILGFHAIEEALKQAPSGSILYICRNMEKRNDRLESLAKTTAGVSVRKIAKVEMDRMTQGQIIGALSLNSPERGNPCPPHPRKTW